LTLKIEQADNVQQVLATFPIQETRKRCRIPKAPLIVRASLAAGNVCPVTHWFGNVSIF
jgi:hypothetical protein